jgi:hypothetical protein
MSELMTYSLNSKFLTFPVELKLGDHQALDIPLFLPAILWAKPYKDIGLD